MKIKLTSVYVDDQDKALRFYTEVLGFAKKTDFSNGPYRWLTVASPEEPDGMELQLSAVRLLGRGHGQPAKWALTKIGLLGKAQDLRIEAQGLVLVVHEYAGQFDFHFVSPFSRSRSGARRLLLVFLFVGID